MEINTFIFPTIASALLLGFYDVAKKRAVLDNPVAPTLFFSNLCGSVFFVAALAICGRLAPAAECTFHQWLLILFKATLVGSSWACVYYAMRELPISIAAADRLSICLFL